TVPAWGPSRPSRMRRSVDLPAPFGPASAANSPARTSRLTRSSTTSAPYANDTSAADSTTGSGSAGSSPGSSELSMILIMPARPGDLTTGGENAAMAHDHGHAGHDHSDALRRTAARNVGRLWIALVLAAAGLAVNLIVFLMLRDGAQDSLAVRGAYVDAMADAAGSVGVIVAAVVIATTGWDPIDPIVAAVIGVWILPRAWRLAASALRVLLQVAPAHVDLDAIRTELLALPGVVDVHDLHVWTLTSEMDVASAHVMIGPG